MLDQHQLSRIPETQRIAQEIERPRDICRLSRELLNGQVPDTFLGRKTQEPFRMIDDE